MLINNVIQIEAALLSDTFVFVDLPVSKASPFIAGTDGDDRLVGSDSGDNITAFDGDDTVSAGEGNDLIGGGDGSDNLDGGRGDDTIHGGSGDDEITGGTGDDELTGGTGADTFHFQALYKGWGQDTVTDFEPGQDHLSIMSGRTAVPYAALSITGNGNGDTLIEYNGSSILLLGISPSELSADDFVF